MDNKANCFQKSVFLSALLLSPAAAFAHLISITPTTPFPTTIAVPATSSAVFTVTNISAKAHVTVVDNSSFPADSGLSITSNTCGVTLAPAQSCTITVTLTATTGGRTVRGTLREWAKPTVDGVEFPISIRLTGTLPHITLNAITNGGLPALREPIVAHNNGKWLIVSGTTGDFHDFDYNSFITDLYVYNPSTKQVYTANVSKLGVGADSVRRQLISSDPEFLQDGDTLYIIGGYYTDDNVNWTTLQTISAINIPGMINGIINGDADLSSHVTFNDSIADFKVTGGQLGKIGNYFYLTFGQDYEGVYSGLTCYRTKRNFATQTYTNSIYKFTTDPTLSTITIVDIMNHCDDDDTGWRRRDYNMAPFMIGNTETLFAMGGPFTRGSNALVWTNGITFDEQMQSNDHFINQQANQYSSAVLPMYSASKQISYVATFSGLSNLYWGSNGLVYDNSTPYGNVLDLITSDANGNAQEYANLTPICGGQPLSSCLYTGLVANFIAVDNYYDSRGILQLDQLPQTTPTLVGYVYGGLVSTTQNIFGFPNNASNQVYEIYVTPLGTDSIHWRNVTNANPGT